MATLADAGYIVAIGRDRRIDASARDATGETWQVGVDLADG